MDNIKNRLMVDSPTAPRYKGVFDAYRQTWRETFDPSKGLGANSLARVRNFYRVSQICYWLQSCCAISCVKGLETLGDQAREAPLTITGLRPSRASCVPDQRGGAGRVGDDDALGNEVERGGEVSKTLGIIVSIAS